MVLLNGDNGQIDFHRPLILTPDEYDEFVSLMEEFYDPVETVTVASRVDLQRARLGDHVNVAAPWSVKETVQLLKIQNTTEDLMHKLGRSVMGVEMRRGKENAKFLPQLQKDNLDPARLSDEELEAAIQRYMDIQRQEREQFLAERRAHAALRNPKKLLDEHAKVVREVGARERSVKAKPSDRARQLLDEARQKLDLIEEQYLEAVKDEDPEQLPKEGQEILSRHSED